MKTKIKSRGNVVANFYDKKLSKVESNHNCLAVISLDSVLKKDDNYYLQVLLKECKYIEYKNNYKNTNTKLNTTMIRRVKENLSDFSFSDESDKE